MGDVWFVAAGYALTAASLASYVLALRGRARRARARAAEIAGRAGP